LLPPELLRRGRFDEIFFVYFPSARERGEIFAIHLRKRGRDPGRFDLPRLAAETDGFSGAEIEQAVVAALYEAFDRGRDLLMEDVLRCVEECVPLSVAMREEIGALRK